MEVSSPPCPTPQPLGPRRRYNHAPAHTNPGTPLLSHPPSVLPRHVLTYIHDGASPPVQRSLSTEKRSKGNAPQSQLVNPVRQRSHLDPGANPRLLPPSWRFPAPLPSHRSPLTVGPAVALKLWLVETQNPFVHNSLLSGKAPAVRRAFLDRFSLPEYLAYSPQTSALAHTPTSICLFHHSLFLHLRILIPSRSPSPPALSPAYSFLSPPRALARPTGQYLQTLGPARANPLDYTNHRRALGAKPTCCPHQPSPPWSATAATTRSPGCHRPTQPHTTPGRNRLAPTPSRRRRSIRPASHRM